jgi:hypothetical protein
MACVPLQIGAHRRTRLSSPARPSHTLSWSGNRWMICLVFERVRSPLLNALAPVIFHVHYRIFGCSSQSLMDLFPSKP